MRLHTFLVHSIAVATLAVAGTAQPSQTDEESIRLLIAAFANARNMHNGEAAAALYSEDGEWISAHGSAVRGRNELARLWSGVTGQVQRTVQSVDFPGSHIAVVHVTTQYDEPIGRHHEVFIVVDDDGKWNIRVHQSTD